MTGDSYGVGLSVVEISINSMPRWGRMISFVIDAKVYFSFETISRYQHISVEYVQLESANRTLLQIHPTMSHKPVLYQFLNMISRNHKLH